MLSQLFRLFYASDGLLMLTGQDDAPVPAALRELVGPGAELAHDGGGNELVEGGEEGVLKILGTGGRIAWEEVGESEGGGDGLGGVLEGEEEQNTYDARGVVCLVFETLDLLTVLSIHCFLLVGLLSY